MKKTFLLGCCLALALPTLAQEKQLKGAAMFGNLRARQIGPAKMSGRITDIEGVDKNPKIIYLGAANGGVWKSENGGVSFLPIFDQFTQSVGKITVDQKRSDTLWVGTGETWVRNSTSVGTGLYRSTNGGKSWEFKGLENSERISSILINPENPDIVYVGVMGALWNGNAERGVYKTTDGGKTWEKIFYIDDNTGCADMAIDPQNPNVLYASMWEFRRKPYLFTSGGKSSGLFKSTDGGKTWNKIHNGFPKGDLGRFAIVVSPTKPNILYATAETQEPGDKGFYRSEDAGASWKKIGGNFDLTVRPFYFSRLVIDPKDENVVYKAGLNGIISVDGGKTFRNVGGNIHSDIHDFWVNPQNTDNVFVATDGGLYRSWDKTNVCEMVKGLPLSQFYHVSVDNARPYNVYGGLQDNGSWFAPSRKDGGVQNRDWQNVGFGDGFYAHPHPTDKNVVFSEAQGGMMFRRYLSTGQMKDIKPYRQKDEPELRFNWCTPIVMSPTNPQKMYCGGQFLYSSVDMGDSWTKLSLDLTTNDKAKYKPANPGGLSMDNSSAENHCTIFTIGESPKSEQTIWVGTDDGNVQVTTDGGKNWANVTANLVTAGVPAFTWVSHVEPSHFDVNTCYVTFDGHRNGNKKTYIFKTTDLGKTWKSVATPDIKGYAHIIREDLVNPNLLFVGTEFGLFISIDGGTNWSAFTNNMPPVAVPYMVIHPRDHDLVLATHGRGIMIIDDITPLRQLTPEAMSKSVHFIESKPCTLPYFTTGQEFPGAGEYTGEEPSDIAQIKYYLSKRHTFGDMYLEVFDEAGKRVAKLPAGKSAGLNTVEWNMRLKLPKTAVGKTIAAGVFLTPLVKEGKYKVKLTKGKETFETIISVEAEANSPYSEEERKSQNQTAMRLYDMTEQLAYIATTVQDAKKVSDEHAKANPKLAKNLNVFSKEMEDFNKKLVVTTGDDYVASADPELREKIADLSRSVAFFSGKPSNSQLASFKVLEGELAEAQKKLDEIKAKKIPAINAQLKKNNLAEIKVLTWEEFKAKED